MTTAPPPVADPFAPPSPPTTANDAAKAAVAAPASAPTSSQSASPTSNGSTPVGSNGASSAAAPAPAAAAVPPTVTTPASQANQAAGSDPADDSIPKFEGHTVDSTAAKVSSVTALEIGNRVFKHDQIVTMIIECRVDGVAHVVNQTTGKMQRQHMLKAIDSLVVDTDIDTFREVYG